MYSSAMLGAFADSVCLWCRVKQCKGKGKKKNKKTRYIQLYFVTKRSRIIISLVGFSTLREVGKLG